MHQKHFAQTKLFIPSSVIALEFKSSSDSSFLTTLSSTYSQRSQNPQFCYSYKYSWCNPQHWWSHLYPIESFDVFTTFVLRVFVSFQIVENFGIILTFITWIVLGFLLFFFYLINILLRIIILYLFYHLSNFRVIKLPNCII